MSCIWVYPTTDGSPLSFYCTGHLAGPESGSQARHIPGVHATSFECDGLRQPIQRVRKSFPEEWSSLLYEHLRHSRD